MAFWLRPRNQAGGPRWSKTAMRCKLPVLQQGQLGKKGFFSTFCKTFILSFSCKSSSFRRFLALIKKTIITDFHKPFGKNMQRKPPDKLPVRECHLFFNGSYAVILVIKSHVLLVNALDSIITDGDFMALSSQIFHHRFWTSKRFLGKYHPWFLK